MQYSVGPLYATESATTRSDGHVDRSQSNVWSGRWGSSACDYAYLKFADFPALATMPSNAAVISATLTLRVWEAERDAKFGFQAFACASSWDKDTITWANRPSAENIASSFSLASPTWYTVDISTIVQAWLTNDAYDYADGLFIRPNSTNNYSGKKIASVTTSAPAFINIVYDVPASVPTLDKTAYTLGDTVNLSLEVQEEDATHTVAYYIGDETTAYTTHSLAVGTTVDMLNIPETAAFGEKFPDSLSTTLRVSVTTTVDDSVRGTAEVTAIITVPDDSAPTATCADTRTGQTQVAAYIQKQSGVALVVTATPKYGATIASYSVTFEGVTQNSASATYSVINGSGDIEYTYSVTDTRGLKTSGSGVISVYAWATPSIQRFIVNRANASASISIDGTYSLATVYAQVSAFADADVNNTLSYKVQYRQSGDTAWIDSDTLTATEQIVDTSYLLQSSSTDISTFSDLLGYEFQLVVSDRFASSTALAEIPTKDILMHFKRAEKSVAFGMESTGTTDEAKFEVAQKAYFYGPVEFAGGVPNLGIQAGSAADLGNTGASSYKDGVVTFPVAFKGGTIPVVVIGFVTLSTAGTFGRCSVAVKHESITNAGFEFRFYNGDSNNRNPAYSWIAFGEPDI